MKTVYLEGLSFSFRCIHPTTGVSPLTPILFLLLGWYMWGMMQTWRLRFSENARPHITNDPEYKMDRRFLVTEQDIHDNRKARHWALCGNIECLMFGLRILRQIFRSEGFLFEIIAACAFGAAMLWLCLFNPSFRSFDHFLWLTTPLGATPYELAVGLLMIPLAWVSMIGWLRLMFIWESLRSNLLLRLEERPIRFAFDRLKGTGWMAMLSRASLSEQRRDMDRCIESMSQLLHDAEFTKRLDKKSFAELFGISESIVKKRKKLRERRRGLTIHLPPTASAAETRIRDCDLMKEIDEELAEFGAKLMEFVLIHYWEKEKSGLVEEQADEGLPIVVRPSEEWASHRGAMLSLWTGKSASAPADIAAAEEFVAIRYLSLIRAVLANMRYLAAFISLTFVLGIVAWNSYPFQPRQIVDWMVTGFFAVLGSGIVRVFAQMHRDPILSRITDTKPNELGWDFYFRIATYGAIPVLTWLAYEFPDIGNVIYRFVQPGTSAFK
jgi:hypothetical protein